VDAIDHLAHLLGAAEDVAQLLAVELIDREDVPAGHAVGGVTIDGVTVCAKPRFQFIQIE